MPRSLATRVPTLHIYRHLLREASYLPPPCQTFAQKQIRERFRRHHHDPPLAPTTRTRVRRARHDLRYLWAANNGLMANMLRILMLSFGRLGKRRRTLIASFLAKTGPADSDELERQMAQEALADESSSGGTKKKREPDWLDAWDLPKFHALTASQSHQTLRSPRPEIKGNKLDPRADIPDQNIWGRPPAARLQRTKIRKWYIRQVNRLMPPVERAEWDRLRLLATGRADRSLWAMPARRRPGTSLCGGDGGGQGSWDWRRYAVEPVRSVERGSSRSYKARTGEQGEAPYGLGKPIGLHRYDAVRFWRRLYAKVWEITPTMEKDEDRPDRWKVEWGRTERDLAVATPTQVAFFAGAVGVKANKRRGKVR